MKENILIVEDEESLRMTLGVRLRSEGYEVDTASGGIEGFKKATSRPYDLIILDILLPDRSGLDVCREIRQAGTAARAVVSHCARCGAGAVPGDSAGARSGARVGGGGPLHAGKVVVIMANLKATLANAAPEGDLTPPLVALWWAAKGDWDAAHKIVQDESDKDAAWVHAYLHRVEGDLGNAGYWYRQAGRTVAKDTLQTEWERSMP